MSEEVHYNDVIMGAIASQITSLTIVYSTVYSDADQRKHQSSSSLAFVRGIHRGPLNSPHKWPVTRKSFPFDDVIMVNRTVGVALLWNVAGNYNEAHTEMIIKPDNLFVICFYLHPSMGWCILYACQVVDTGRWGDSVTIHQNNAR